MYGSDNDVCLTIYSIGDNQKIQYFGGDLGLLIHKKHLAAIETYVGRFLRKKEFDATFVNLYKYESECMNGNLGSCRVGLVDSKVLFIFMIMFLLVFLYMISKSFVESKDKEKQKERLDQIVLNIIKLRSQKIKIDQLLREKCMLCLDELITREIFDNITLVCQHTFHALCFQTWEKIHSKCPLCRVQIKEKKKQVPIRNSQIFPNDFIFIDSLLLIQYDLNRGMFSQKQLKQIYEVQKSNFLLTKPNQDDQDDSVSTNLLSNNK